ncbi:collagen binding domain-containing protein [Ureibacillus sinduriensis]|uniref:Gram-positive cocci surface proteins LPxTG domain-containing protein n=1 Tax=Ureibacillus sinduriensis BLB-1 = JCM 15800 TaxID=1384057 RepID=A0A0A3IM57_9BACL|nr:collagen binding domain-containing protein [Ureibacillus sinduriensis]KGR75927.1 hypothetical protein CD33_08785 [Ureibacillus sinduriensis BLB-1 = JCM 15800]
MRKLNIGIIVVLLVFQTLLSPISVFASEDLNNSSDLQALEDNATGTPANENQPLPEVDNGTNNDTGNEAGTEAGSGETGEGTENSGGEQGSGEGTENGSGEQGAEEGAEPGSEEPGAEEGTETGTEPGAEEGAEAGDGELVDGIQPGTLQAVTDPEELHATLSSFKMMIDSEEVTVDYNKELTKDTAAKFEVTFDVVLDKMYAAGSWFEFQLPNSLIDFDKAFFGNKEKNDGINPAYSYSTTDNNVKVVLDEDLPIDFVGDAPVQFTMSFTSGFHNLSNELEQELEIPTSGEGTQKISLKFLPSTTNEKVSKSAIGNPQLVDGNHQMDWEVWVNKAGKDLSGAVLSDNPASGHSVIKDSITVEKYAVNLNGVDTSASIGSTSIENFPISLEDGRYAYKVTYKTEVDLSAAEREGAKTFANTVTFTNGGVTETASASQSVTYGKALEKSLDADEENTNYQSHWEIRYNYNQVLIPESEAWIEDTLESPHEIDFDSIKVYEVQVTETGEEESSTEISGYSIEEDEGNNKFKISFGDTAKAYKIKYKAIYNEKDFYTENRQEFINKVVSGNGKTAQDSHTLREGILSKSRTIDFENKKIKWTISIKADNAPITNLKLDDTFEFGSITGKHTLEGSVEVSGTTDSSYTTTIKDNDPSKGFEITGINIAEGSTATIVYTTKFDIAPDGSVDENGYGNSATATWISGTDSYSLTKTSDYNPETTTKNNGSKAGSFNYQTQEFTWGIKVNINKTNINGATLTDTLGTGHQIIQDSIKVYEYQLEESGSEDGDDTKGTKGNELSAGYTVSPISDTSFTLTFNGLIGGAENKVYFVEYKTKDSNDILGIESDNENDPGNVYTNGATFTTPQGKSYNIGSAQVTVNNANQLIKKSVSGNSSSNSTDILKWTIEVNQSRSALGSITLTDKVSESLILDPNTIEYREETSVDQITGTISYTQWKKPTADMLTTSSDSGFELVLNDPANPNKAYQVRYDTVALAKQGDPFSNSAKIDFGFTTSENQKTEYNYSNNFAFSSSDTSFSLTKGNAKLQKVGFNPETGEKVSLSGVNFELIKTIGKGTSKKDYVIASATSDADGYFEFNNINYGTYKIKEIAAPDGYELMSDFTFVLGLDNDTNIEGNENKVTEVENVKDVEEANMCPQFTLTIRDVDGNLVANKEVVLKDGDRVVSTQITNNAGELVIPRTGEGAIKAGKYSVHEGEEFLGETTVKFTKNDCEAELQPVNSCPVFTIKLKDKDGNARQNVTVTLKDKDGTVIKTDTTNSEGEITIPPTTKAGKYDLYEDKQFLSEVNVTYKDGCLTEVEEAPTCPDFTLTVNDVNGKTLEAGVTILIQNVDSKKEFTGTTNAEGKVTFSPLEPGKYVVYEGSTLEDAKKMGEFVVDTTCEAVVQPAPACPVFTIAVKDQDGKVRPNVKVTVKDSDGKIVAKDIVSNGNGEISVDTTILKSGNYNIYENELFLGSITVDYKLDCNAELIQAPVCPMFTLTVQNVYGIARKDVKVEIREYKGNVVGDTIATETTDENGEVTVQPNKLKPGNYIVFELDADGKNIATLGVITVDNSCAAIVKPIPSGGGGGGYIPPTDPGENPGKPGDTPKDPNKPGDTPKDPNKPGDTPKDPNKPGETPTNPDGDDPTDSDVGDSTDSDGNPSSPNDEAVESANDGSDKDVANASDNNGKNTNAEKLPQTDGKSNLLIVLLGILLVTTSIIALARRRKMA